jgi:serine/threonine protein phosphatase PrpC
MVQLIPLLLDGLARTVSAKKGSSGKRNCKADDHDEEIAVAASRKYAAEAMAKEAKKKELMLTSTSSSGNFVNSNTSNNFASVCSTRGQKGINQDSLVVWEEFGCEEDTIFCGVFDGHGPWGHIVSKTVSKSAPSSLLCNWQQTLADPNNNIDLELDREFEIWKQSYLKTYAEIDRELKNHTGIDSYHSGTTALTIVKQGEDLIIANVGDSRAVLATIDGQDGNLVPLQLSVDLKPNLPEEAERIKQSRGRVFCLDDEPGVYRVWPPDENGSGPGLAISRALGDYCVKEFGLISIPDITHRNITSRDQFLILATDGLWDVVSNQEAVKIVASTPEREKSAKRLVKYAARAWKYKKGGIAMDDISAICLFFHQPPR